jgi:16S rRNA (guanine527-N7)-methyltransferase
VAREGLGETRPRTGRAREDRPGRGATSDDGSGSHGRHAGPEEACLRRRREPLPTRVRDVPALPPSFRAALDPALARLGVRLERPAFDAIEGHVRLLLAWNRAINLTAIADPDAVAVRHVADSLAAVPVLRASGARALLDLGTGGGYPGLPLAVALPFERVLLVDSVAKKAGFLAVVVEALGLAGRVAVAADRAETLAHGVERERWSAVTARAVASLPDLVELAFPLLEPDGTLIAWKGRLDDRAELAAAERAVDALGGGEISVLNPALDALPDHRLVVVTKGGRTPDGFPRDPAARRRRPLGGSTATAL